MSAIIPGAIPTQSYELVRDRLAAIILVEMNNQAVLGYHPDLNIDKVYRERFSRINQSECKTSPVVNIVMERGDFSKQDQRSVHGTYRFYIEVTTREPGTESDESTSKSKTKLHRILGTIRAIIQNSLYNALAFDPPFVINRHVEAIMFNKPDDQSWDASCQGFLIVVVTVPETTNTKDFPVVSNYTTSVRIGESEQGYYWELFVDPMTDILYADDGVTPLTTDDDENLRP